MGASEYFVIHVSVSQENGDGHVRTGAGNKTNLEAMLSLNLN